MNFDRVARFYQCMERFAAGHKLQVCRTAYLARISPPRRVLIAGEGHGNFLAVCAQQFPQANITVVDSSAKMIEIAQRQVASKRVTFHHADILKWRSEPASYDLIVTHFFLDCFPPNDLAKVIDRLGNAATSDADWLVADFQIPTVPIFAWRSRMILALLYRFFRLTTALKAQTLASPDGDLIRVGFIRMHHQSYDWRLLKSEWWQRRPPSNAAS